MAKRQDIGFDEPLYSGNHADITVTVDNGETPPVAKNLAGVVSITWSLSATKGGTAVLTRTLGTGIAVTDAANGKFMISLVPADTEGLAGNYYHEATIKDSGNKVATVVYGNCLIEQNTNQIA